MTNKLCFIHQDSATTVYCTKIRQSSEVFVRAITCITLHNYGITYFVISVYSARIISIKYLVVSHYYTLIAYSFRVKIVLLKKLAKNSGLQQKNICANDPCQELSMDYGFICSTDATNTEDGPLVTNKNSYNCYLLIVDKFNRNVWVFLFANKKPQLTHLLIFLKNHRIKSDLK